MTGLAVVTGALAHDTNTNKLVGRRPYPCLRDAPRLVVVVRTPGVAGHFFLSFFSKIFISRRPVGVRSSQYVGGCSVDTRTAHIVFICPSSRKEELGSLFRATFSCQCHRRAVFVRRYKKIRSMYYVCTGRSVSSLDCEAVARLYNIVSE